MYQQPFKYEFMLDNPHLNLSTEEQVDLHWLAHPEDVPRAVAVSEKDIKNAKARSANNTWKLHADDTTSVNMWYHANKRIVLHYDAPVAGKRQARAFTPPARSGVGGAARRSHAKARALDGRAQRLRATPARRRRRGRACSSCSSSAPSS